MNKVNQKIKNKIVEPAATSRSVSTLSAKITKVNEKTNTCDVMYTRIDGTELRKKDVTILLNNTSFIDWFPEVNDQVLIQEKNNIVYIIGPAYSDYNKIRKKIELKNDIYSNSFIDTLGGFIF
jgi:hypothetical protein